MSVQVRGLVSELCATASLPPKDIVTKLQPLQTRMAIAVGVCACVHERVYARASAGVCAARSNPARVCVGPPRRRSVPRPRLDRRSRLRGATNELQLFCGDCGS